MAGCESPPKSAQQSSTQSTGKPVQDSASASPQQTAVTTPASAPGTAPAAVLPPVTPASAPQRLESNDGSFLVLYRTRPDPIPTNEPFSIDVWVYDAKRGQTLLSEIEVVADAGMPEHAHGMNVQPRVWKQNDGSSLITGMLFHMPGRWELYFDITRGEVTERAQAEVWLD